MAVSKVYSPVSAEVEVNGKKVSKTVLCEYDSCENLGDLSELASVEWKDGERKVEWLKVQIIASDIPSSWGKDFKPGEYDLIRVDSNFGGKAVKLSDEDAEKRIVKDSNEQRKRESYSTVSQILRANLEGPDKALERVAEALVKNAARMGKTVTLTEALAIARNSPDVAALFLS